MYLQGLAQGIWKYVVELKYVRWENINARAAEPLGMVGFRSNNILVILVPFITLVL